MQQINTLTGGIYFGYYKDEARSVECWVDKIENAAKLVAPMRLLPMIHLMHSQLSTNMKITEELYSKEIDFMRQQITMYGSTKIYSTEYKSPEHKQCEVSAKYYELDVDESEIDKAIVDPYLVDPDFILEDLYYAESTSSFSFIGIEDMCRIHNTTHTRGVVNPNDDQYKYVKYP